MAVTLLDPEFLRRLEMLTLRARRPVRGVLRGERRSRTRGRGVEFADYRSYQVGDDYRHIDWNIYSRLDRLFVKLFSEEEDTTVHLLVDTSASMAWGQPSKALYAARVAAAIGYVGLVGLDRVGVAFFADRLRRTLPPVRGRGQSVRLMEFLADAAAPPPSATSDLRQTLHEYVHRTRRRGLLVLLSDLLFPAGYEDGLVLARAHRFEPFVIHVLSDDELAPAVRGDLRLVDRETRVGVEVTVDGPALDAYARARDRYLRGVEEFCLRHQIDYVRVSTSLPAEDLVLRYLRLGGLFR